MGSCTSKIETSETKNKTLETKKYDEPEPLWKTDPVQHEMNQFVAFYGGKRID
jgi:hypothetical protein